ncbi:MAG: acyl carrier protein [Gemmatimonadaceae bacterium]|nr:acyl carrier protein [Gemmatimonadaceae bacterium]
MITEEQIFACIHKVNAHLDTNAMSAEGDLRKMGLDSLDMFSLLLELQELTGVEIPDEDIPSVQSVAKLREYLVARSVGT